MSISANGGTVVGAHIAAFITPLCASIRPSVRSGEYGPSSLPSPFLDAATRSLDGSDGSGWQSAARFATVEPKSDTKAILHSRGVEGSEKMKDRRRRRGRVHSGPGPAAVRPAIGEGEEGQGREGNKNEEDSCNFYVCFF